METFNTTFSLYKFIKSVAADFTLDVFLNQKLTPAEEAKIATLDRWLVVSLNPDITDLLQPIFLNLALYATPDADPTLKWLQKTPQQMNKMCIQRKTHHDTNMRLIKILDYDSYVGASAIATFQQTGTIPATLITALGLDYPTIPLWEPLGQKTGFQFLENSAPKLDTMDSPYKVTWSMTFRYYDPESMMGSTTL